MMKPRLENSRSPCSALRVVWRTSENETQRFCTIIKPIWKSSDELIEYYCRWDLLKKKIKTKTIAFIAWRELILSACSVLIVVSLIIDFVTVREHLFKTWRLHLTLHVFITYNVHIQGVQRKWRHGNGNGVTHV